MDPIRARLVELVPEIVELKVGCVVEIAELGKLLISQEINNDNVQLVPFGVSSKLGISQAESHIVYMSRELLSNGLLNKILGRPIQLADVLRAIPDKSAANLGGFTRDLLNLGWNLAEHFDNQDQPVKDYVGRLLNVTT